MARQGTQQNNAANDAYTAAQTTQLNNINAATGKYNADAATLQNGGNIGANPFATSEYLSNENRLASTAADATGQGAKAELVDNALRTGDNSSSTTQAVKNIQRTGQQEANTALTQQASQDYLSNLSWQQGLLGNDLGATGVENSVYGTASTGLNNTDTNLTNLGIASYGPLNSIIGAAGTAAGAFLGPKTPKGCWIAAAVFDGWDDPRTSLVRSYLWEVADKKPIGHVLMSAYMRFGERVARVVKRNRLVRAVIAPLFNRALKKAERWRGAADAFK